MKTNTKNVTTRLNEIWDSITTMALDHLRNFQEVFSNHSSKLKNSKLFTGTQENINTATASIFSYIPPTIITTLSQAKNTIPKIAIDLFTKATSIFSIFLAVVYNTYNDMFSKSTVVAESAAFLSRPHSATVSAGNPLVGESEAAQLQPQALGRS